MLAKGARCTVSGSRGFPPVACAYGLTCVLDSLGRPEVDVPDAGTCEATPAKVPACTLEGCAAAGADGVCRLNNPDRVTTCGVYATVEGVCDVFCAQFCLPDLLCDSDGNAYCNGCILGVALCRGGFTATGPVEGATCSFGGDGGDGDGDGGGDDGGDDDGGDGGGGGGGAELDCSGYIDVFDAPRCCTELGVGCIGKGETCTSGALIPAVPCADGLTCVITDLGFLAADAPDAGTCEVVEGKPPTCSTDFCEGESGGNDARCNLRGRIVTCAAFAKGEDHQ